MKKFLIVFCLITMSSIFAMAQDSDNEYNKNEFFVGFSHQNVGSVSNREGFNGVNGSYVRNVSRFFGVKADFSATYKTQNFDSTINDPVNGNFPFSVKSRRSVYNMLGGVQIKDNASQKRLKPFAHALIGVGVNRSKVTISNCQSPTCEFVNGSNFTDTGLSGAFGGGLDIKISDKIDFRAIQVDYNPIYSDSRVDQNVRFGIGIVFK